MALKLAALACVLAATTPGALAIRPAERVAHVAQRATLADEAASSRNLLLFGLTQRDKAAHDEHRDAMIEVRAQCNLRAPCASLSARTARARLGCSCASPRPA